MAALTASELNDFVHKSLGFHLYYEVAFHSAGLSDRFLHGQRYEKISFSASMRRSNNIQRVYGFRLDEISRSVDSNDLGELENRIFHCNDKAIGGPLRQLKIKCYPTVSRRV